MEAADGIAAEMKAAEAALARRTTARRRRHARGARRPSAQTLDAELARLADERSARGHGRRPAPLWPATSSCSNSGAASPWRQMIGELCTACHVRLRPHVAQQIRRNDAIVQCDSCQRILYFAAATGAVDVIAVPTSRRQHRRRRARQSRTGRLGRRRCRTPDGARHRRAAWAPCPTPPTTSPSTRACSRRSTWCAEHGAAERARALGFAAARAADARRLQGQERRTEAAPRPGAAARAPDRHASTYEHVRRELNKDADRLANLAMDEAATARESRSCGHESGCRHVRPQIPPARLSGRAVRASAGREAPAPSRPSRATRACRAIRACRTCRASATCSGARAAAPSKPTTSDCASTCGKCGVDLHACIHCASFDAGARFECMQPIPARVSPKDARNDVHALFAAREGRTRDRLDAGSGGSRRQEGVRRSVQVLSSARADRARIDRAPRAAAPSARYEKHVVEMVGRAERARRRSPRPARRPSSS